VENKYVFKWALKVVSDSPVSRRLKGSSFHARGPAAAKESAVLTWHRADTSLGGPQGSPSGIGNQLTVADKVIRRQAQQCTEGETRSPACTGYVNCRTGSQCSCRSAGVMCSHIRVPVTRRAAAFCTDCSRRRRPSL